MHAKRWKANIAPIRQRFELLIRRCDNRCRSALVQTDTGGDKQPVQMLAAHTGYGEQFPQYFLHSTSALSLLLVNSVSPAVQLPDGCASNGNANQTPARRDQIQLTRIWARSDSVVDDINLHHQNSRFLPDVNLPEALTAFKRLDEAMEGSRLTCWREYPLILIDHNFVGFRQLPIAKPDQSRCIH